MNPKTALLLGGSGFVGRFCLQSLLHDNHYGKIIILTRRPLQIENALTVGQWARGEKEKDRPERTTPNSEVEPVLAGDTL